MTRYKKEILKTLKRIEGYLDKFESDRSFDKINKQATEAINRDESTKSTTN